MFTLQTYNYHRIGNIRGNFWKTTNLLNKTLNITEYICFEAETQSSSPSLSSLPALSFFDAVGFLFCGSVSQQRNSRGLQNAAVRVRPHLMESGTLQPGHAYGREQRCILNIHHSLPDVADKTITNAEKMPRCEVVRSRLQLIRPLRLSPHFFLFNGLNIS